MRALFPSDFARLWTASAISTIGDGVTVVAGPLLLTTITSDPALIAGAIFAEQLPWLLFGLTSGAVVDRVDRRRLIAAIDFVRAAALSTLIVSLMANTRSVVLVYAVLFILGAGSTLAGPAAGALLPAVVPPDRLTGANARLGATFTIGHQLLAKPLGAALFAVSSASPFAVDAVSFVAAGLLVLRIEPPPAEPPPAEPRPERSLRREIAEGLSWLGRHRLLRSLAITMGVANVAFGAAFAVFVLYARDRLGVQGVGYGVLLTAFAAGGLAGASVATRLTARFGVAAVLHAGLLVEVSTHVVLAVTTSVWVAGAALVVFSVHAMVWGVVVTALRQRIVPGGLLGRVGSVHALIDLGGAAVGSLAGGLLADAWSITTPFWVAAVVTGAATAGAWRVLSGAPLPT